MGNFFYAPSKYLMPHLWREDEPKCFAPYKYDPQFGYPEGRLPVECPATVQEMDSANIEDFFRDECAKYNIAYRGCLYGNAPFWWKCKGLKREFDHCYTLRHVNDMKEFEREYRLNVRERRLANAAAS